jgi:actin-related protein
VSTINTIELYNLLRNKIGEKEAQALTEYVYVQVDEKFAEKKDLFATKEDIYQLKQEVVLLREEVRVEMKEQKAELLKWMIVLFAPFYIGMIVFLIKQFL